MKTIAVTGSSGFIGRHLVKELSRNFYNVIEIAYDKGYNLLKNKDLDRIDPFDTIVHLAAHSFVPEAFENPRTFYQENFTSTLNVLELAKKFNSKVIYFSSYLYGNPEYLPIDENHPLKPQNPYSQSKLICEKLCEGYSRDFNIPLIIFRPFNIYGNGQNKSFLIPSILEQLETGEITLQDPRPKRDFIHVQDVIRAVIKAVEYNKSRFELFNLGSGKSYSISEVVTAILEASFSSSRVHYTHEIRQGEVLDTVASTSKICADLNWKPEIDFTEGVKMMIESEYVNINK